MSRAFVVDGVEYALDINGNRYEVMIPGTKCPVSAGVLEQWYWEEQMSLRDICSHLENVYFCRISDSTILRIFTNTGINLRNNKQATQIKFRKKPGLLAAFLEKAGRNGTTAEHLKSIRGKAIKNRIINNQARRVVKICPLCFTKFSVRQCEAHRIYCSKSCALRRPNKNRVSINGLLCPYCYRPSVSLRKRYFKHAHFKCLCQREFVRPIIELGLRQDLEAAGALDNGRILLSAFVTEKEKATTL